jgi:hypothetical protein
MLGAGLEALHELLRLLFVDATDGTHCRCEKNHQKHVVLPEGWQAAQHGAAHDGEM